MPKILPLLRLLPLAVAALSLTGCADRPVRLPPPPVDRFAPVALPVAPAGEALCDDEGSGQVHACLSQAEVDHLFNAAIDALCRANNKLAWLSDFYHDTKLPDMCR